MAIAKSKCKAPFSTKSTSGATLQQQQKKAFSRPWKAVEIIKKIWWN